MKILLITQYFWPEQFIINDLVKELAHQGHSIYVLTGKPNYPGGIVFSGYTQADTMVEEFIPGVQVFRAPLRPRGLKSGKNLFLNYCSFVFNGCWYFPKAIKGQSFDVILSFGLSPITSVLPAIIIKKKLKSHLAVWVQDLWPDSLKATGYIKNKYVLWLVGCLVRGIYYCSDTLLVQSKGFKIQVKRFANEGKIIYYPNSFVPQVSVEYALSRQIISTLENNFCLVFAGNLGTVQALDTLLDAAKVLVCIEEFRLILVGSGSMTSHLQQRVLNEELTNVIMAGHYPTEAMPGIFKRASALIVSLNSDQLFSYTVPSKVQAYLAAGRPIIAALHGESADIVNEAGAGLTCSAENTEELISCIKQLHEMPLEERENMGQLGRAYFLKHFEISVQAKRLIDILKQRLSYYEK